MHPKQRFGGSILTASSATSKREKLRGAAAPASWLRTIERRTSSDRGTAAVALPAVHERVKTTLCSRVRVMMCAILHGASRFCESCVCGFSTNARLPLYHPALVVSLSPTNGLPVAIPRMSGPIVVIQISALPTRGGEERPLPRRNWPCVMRRRCAAIGGPSDPTTQ